MGGLESDPWGSPQRTRGRGDLFQTDGAETGAVSNGFGSSRSAIDNAWSRGAPGESAGSETPNGHAAGGQATDDGASSAVAESGWGGYSNTSTSGFEAPDRGAFGGFGSSGDSGDQGDGNAQERLPGMGRTTGLQFVEEINVTMLPEKEGLFLFQHRNYEVKWARRGSTVIRRYSDFVWLLDCLHKRYPFRQLPLLPPKRVAGTL